MTRRARHRTWLRLEALEGRQLLAGDVTAAVVDGNLTILGDEADNELIIFQTAPGSYRIKGGAGTKVNGQPKFLATGVTGNVSISMLGGADGVSMQLIAPADLLITTGSGNDSVSLGGFYEQPGNAQPLTYGVEVLGDLKIKTELDDDFVGIFDSRVAGFTLVKTAEGLDSALLFESHFESNLTLNAGSEDDTLEVSGCQCLSAAKITAGSGNDVMTLAASEFFARPELVGGAGADALTLNSNNFHMGNTIRGFESVT
jgi:hypothetical protein